MHVLNTYFKVRVFNNKKKISYFNVFIAKSAYRITTLPLSPKNFVSTFLTGFFSDIVLSGMLFR